MLRTVFHNCGRRSFSKSSLRGNLEKVKPQGELKPNETAANSTEKDKILNFTPTEFEKTILVLSGRYKTKKSIPDKISHSTMDNAKSRFRIRASNILIILAFALCGYYIYVGKQRQKSGDTILKRQLERDAEILAEARRERENKLN